MSSSPNRSTGYAAAARRRLAATLPFADEDRRWLVLALVPGLVAFGVYLATNPYPAYSGGLFAKIAAEIAANGYALPAHVPGYTAEGVPFAYPPLQFYVLAVLYDLGADPVAVARVLPGVAFLAALVPLYLLARDVTGSRPAGAAATAFAAVNPQLLEWHLSAGGVVRTFAYLYALTAIYCGYHVFTNGDTSAAASRTDVGFPDRRALVGGVVAFGLTVLTHPTYSLFVVSAYLLFWAVLDRSGSGLVAGAVVGVGGGLVASPWLAWVAFTHGPAIFTAAAGTHGGIGGGASALTGDVTVYTLVPVALAVVLVTYRSYLLPAWLAVTELLFEQPRFAYTVAAVLAPALAVTMVREGALDRLGAGRVLDRLPGTSPADRRALAAAVLVLASTAGGGAYLAYEMTLVTDPTTPENLDDGTMAAFAWIESETPPDATVVVVGDTAEWLPALTDRTLLVGPWGVEWRGSDAFERQLAAHKMLSACRSAGCVEAVTTWVGHDPDYVFVPKGGYHVWGDYTVQDGALEQSFERSDDWERAHENDRVVIYRAADQ